MVLLGLIGGCSDDLQVPEGVSPGENGVVREHREQGGLLVQDTPAAPYGPVSDDGRTAAGEEALDATPTPIPLPPPTNPPTPGQPDAGEPAVPEPEPPSAPTPERSAAIICSYSWDCATAIRVFSCESGLRADAISYNGSSCGVAQIWKGHAGRFPGFWEQWMIPEVNIGWAYELWSEQGWGPWSESRNCWWMP